ncbi:MAG: hypothetical protein ACJ8G3_10695 [Burkholderiaceae bacterium]
MAACHRDRASAADSVRLRDHAQESCDAARDRQEPEQHAAQPSGQHGAAGAAQLECIASWEKLNEDREKPRREALRKAVRQQPMNQVMHAKAKQPAKPMSQAPGQAAGEINGGINVAFQQLAFEFSKAAAKLQSNHPETTARIDALALAVEPYPKL